MSFGLNRAEVIGRLGADVTVNSLASGGRVANMSIATDESYVDTFQDGLIDMLVKHAKKGRLVYVAGKMQTRKWRKDGEDSDRFSTEILLVPGGRVHSWTSLPAPTATALRRPTLSPPRPVRPAHRPKRAKIYRSKLPIAKDVKPAGITPCGLSFFVDFHD